MDNNGEYSVALAPMGKIVRDELLKTTQIRSNVKLDEWIIMPNHVHAIIVIDNSVETAPLGRLLKPNQTPMSDVDIETPTTSNIVTPNISFNVLTETPHRALDETPHRGRLYNGERGERHPWHKTQWQPNSLGSIVNQFKSVCTKQIRKINPSFAWQTRYYDRIIRTERALYAVRHYIKTNPDHWHRDRNNPENIWM